MCNEVVQQQHSGVKGYLQPIEHQAEQLHAETVQVQTLLQQISLVVVLTEIIRTIIPPIEVHLHRPTIAIKVQHQAEQLIARGEAVLQEVVVRPEEDNI